jgi:hypothetical protein
MSSIIYKNITIYRTVMQLLYNGKYMERFEPIKKILHEKKPKDLVEFCFGDTIIAEFCKKQNINWRGIDLNENFVERAVKKGFDADKGDIDFKTEIPKSEAKLIMGSLYHFQKDVIPFLLNVLSTTQLFILNEPVSNLSQKKITSNMAGKLSDTGKGAENFRYTKTDLVKLAEEICEISPFSFYIAHEGKKDLTLVFERKN